MHEVGHTLGCVTVSKPTMLTSDKLNDTAITQARAGRFGHDYTPSICQGRKQGVLLDNAWALRLLGDRIRLQTANGRTESRAPYMQRCSPLRGGSTSPPTRRLCSGRRPHTFGIWRDRCGSRRPDDPRRAAQSLADRVTDKGEGYQRPAGVRSLARPSTATRLSSLELRGAECLHRDHRGIQCRDPFMPISGVKQRG